MQCSNSQEYFYIDSKELKQTKQELVSVGDFPFKGLKKKKKRTTIQCYLWAKADAGGKAIQQLL